MRSPGGLQKLLAFARSEHSEENVSFYKETQVYKQAGDSARDALGARIVDNYLCTSAEQPVNLPSKLLLSFRATSSAGEYTYSANLFEAAEREMYRLIQKDTFERFTLSDYASELLVEYPELGDEGGSSSNIRTTNAGECAQARASLLHEVAQWKALVQCDRISLWVINRSGTKLFNVASTQLGNSVQFSPALGQSAC